MTNKKSKIKDLKEEKKKGKKDNNSSLFRVYAIIIFKTSRQVRSHVRKREAKSFDFGFWATKCKATQTDVKSNDLFLCDQKRVMTSPNFHCYLWNKCAILLWRKIILFYFHNLPCQEFSCNVKSSKFSSILILLIN